MDRCALLAGFAALAAVAELLLRFCGNPEFINVKTAKALRLTMLQPPLPRADEVFE